MDRDLYDVEQVDEMTAGVLVALQEIRQRLVARFGEEAGVLVDEYAIESVDLEDE